MNRPAPVEISYDCMRFLITHNPTDAQLGKFIEVRTRPLLFLVLVLTRSVLLQELKAYGVTTLVRVCSATYDRAPLGQEGIQVLVRPDRSSPRAGRVDLSPPEPLVFAGLAVR